MPFASVQLSARAQLVWVYRPILIFRVQALSSLGLASPSRSRIVENDFFRPKPFSVNEPPPSVKWKWLLLLEVRVPDTQQDPGDI
jgi:hypothetical protein